MASAALPPSMTQTVREVCLAARAHPRRSTFPERASLAATADRDTRVLMTRHEEGAFPPPATVSSLNSEDSTEQLICKTPLEEKEVKKVKESVCSKSVEAGSVESSRRRVVLVLGLAQVLAGALLAGAGGAGAARGAALARTGAGLWAGALAVVAGVVGALAGLRDCQPNQPHQDGRNGFLTAFLALSLVCLASGHGAAVLAATGLQRDATRPQAPMDSFQEEMDAWTPVLTNITVLIIACVHCLLCIISIYHVSRRVCSCLRPKPPYDHNQFDPTFRPPLTKLVQLDEKPVKQEEKKTGDIKALEAKLSGEKKKREDWCEWSASSAERAAARAVAARGPARPRGVAKRHPPAHPPMLLIHPASTLGRVPMSVMMPPRYATLPLPPYAPPPAPMFYPVHNPRIRRRGRRSPREPRAERRRRDGRERDSQLTRSLERIHRKRRAERDRLTDAELKRTYTGLDRAYAEQFIAVCDESRHASERLDSLASSATSESPAPRNSRQDGSRSTSAETHSFGGNSA